MEDMTMRYKHRPLAFACYAPEGAGSGTTPPEGGDSGDNDSIAKLYMLLKAVG